ncbi:MAG: DUF5320 domain-containing protein [Firmicutes bacterium]|nr:DUF5320 domain-containing protein [Bacillota bacterium]
MARRDGTGPRGMGPMTGRGFGFCDQGREYGYGPVRGIGRRYGYRYGYGPGRGPGRGFGWGRGFCLLPEANRDFLESQKSWLQSQLEWVTKALEEKTDN